MGSTVTLYSPKGSKYIKLYRNSHTHLTETPSFAWYLAAALKPTSVISLSARKQWLNCFNVPAYQNKDTYHIYNQRGLFSL